MLTFPTPPSPPPPPPTPAIHLAGDSHHSSAPSLLIILAIIAFVVTASASIHLLLRLISRSQSSSPPSPLALLRTRSIETEQQQPPPTPPQPSDRDKLISSLPIFTLSSLQKPQSLDCAVCLSNFRPQDELRLLPACRHAFHSQCIDTWLRSTPSCPLCRASIHYNPTAEIDPSRSGSFRVEIGSVSRRTEGVSTGHARSYSLGSSFEYLVEEDVEAVLDRMRRLPEGKPESGIGAPGSEIAEIAGSGRRGWIRDVVERITSSASSSFNSLRFSGRIGGNNQADLEANGFVEWEEESGFGVFYRWLAGV